MWTNPTITDFQNYFVRDFLYGSDVTTVMPQDISNAISDACSFVNQGLWPTQPAYTQAFLQLTAHFLVTNLRAASQGVQGEYAWLSNNKGVGSVSQGIAIPQRILDNPSFAMLAKTNYGAKYLQLALPQLTGQVIVAHGRTHY